MKISILIAGCGNTTGINVIKAFKGSGIPVIGIDCNLNSVANKFCTVIKVSRCCESNYIDELLKVISDYQITHIIACNDHDVRAVSELYQKNIIPNNIKFNGYCDVILDCLNKRVTEELFIKHRILSPNIIVDKLDFPYVLRIESMGMDEKFVHIIRSERDLDKIPQNELSKGIKTRYIDGEEYTIDIIADDQSNLINAIPRKRIIVEGGMVHHAIAVNDAKLIDKTKEIVAKLRLVGIMCIQCIRSIDNGQYYFIEINPRPGSGIDLSIAAGVNMPLMWVVNQINMNPIIPNWGLQMKRYYSGYFFK